MSIAESSIRPPAAPNDRVTPVACTHCQLPVPAGLVEPGATSQFCCGGCKAAWNLIHGCGLDAFYGMADSIPKGTSSGRSESRAERFAEFDHASFQEKFGQHVAGNCHTISLQLDGIHCAACIWLIEKLPRILPGVQSVQINWARQTAKIVWLGDRIKLSQIAQTLDQLGYRPHPIRERQQDLRRNQENRRHLVRMGVAAAAAGNNMLIAAALYFGMFSHMTLGMNQMLRIASCAVGLVSLLGPGQVFLRGALNALRIRTPHMDLPIALGLTVGSLAGVVNTIRGTGEIWFDSLSVLIFLLLVGRWIQFHQQNRAADSVDLLYRLTPKTTIKRVGGRSVETFVDLLEPGDLLEVRPGDLIPADGIIVEGKTEIDESILSGESRPLCKVTDDPVSAGTQNLRSMITIKATATGRNTRLSKVVELVEQASLEKPEIVLWANRIGGHFVVAVTGIALINLAVWLWIDAAVAIDRTVALLIVACPCALALATPLAISVAIGRAARNKIMVKSGDVMQRLNRPGRIWIDKTGTLTDGKMEIVNWFGDTRWRTVVAQLETTSSHPVAQAFIEHDQRLNSTTDLKISQANREKGVPRFLAQVAGEQFSRVLDYPSLGVGGFANQNHLLVGNARLLLSEGVKITRPQERMADRILAAGLSPCWIAVNGKVVAIASVGDRIRPQVGLSIEQLKAQGWEVGILSGDHQTIVQQVAQRLKIDQGHAIGGLSPEAKASKIATSFEEHETVVMVGDGVNDCAALAVASVGIAVHNGAEASLAAAPVYLAEEGLQPVLTLLKISRATRRTMRTNLTVSIAYNLAGATLAAFGWINPLAAAILMPISSLTVVAISLSAGKLPSPASKP